MDIDFKSACVLMMIVGMALGLLGYLDNGQGIENHKSLKKLGLGLIVTPVVVIFIRATFGT